MRRSNGISVEKGAEHGKEMTLAELEKFTQDARTVGVGDLARVKVRITFGGGIKVATVASGDIVPPRAEHDLGGMD